MNRRYHDQELAREALQAGREYYDQRVNIVSLEQVDVPAHFDGSGNMQPAVRMLLSNGETFDLYNGQLNNGEVKWGGSVYRKGDELLLEKDVRTGRLILWEHWVDFDQYR